MLMHKLVRIMVYAAVYAPFLFLTIWYREKKKRWAPAWIRYMALMTGGMFTVAFLEELSR